jgi:hypothetical protein
MESSETSEYSLHSWIKDILIDHSAQLVDELNLNEILYAAMKLVESCVTTPFDLVRVEGTFNSTSVLSSLYHS